MIKLMILRQADSYSQTTWQLKGGAGNDVIVGGFEKKFANEWMEGDSAIFGADSKYFDVSIEQVAFLTRQSTGIMMVL